MAFLVVLVSVLVVLEAASLQPHRTVVDLDLLNSDLGKQPLQDSNKTNVPIGLLSSFKNLGQMTAAAVMLAVEAANAAPWLLPSHRLQMVAYDSGGPLSSLTIRRMTQLREEGVRVFIGPDHSCVSEALVAAAWNMPMITYKCSDSKVSNKDIFPTFARTLPPSSKVSKSLMALLLHFRWHQVVLVVADSAPDRQVAEALTRLSRRHGINIIDTFHLPAEYLTADNTTLKDIVLKTSDRTRVYVLLADAYILADFVRFMQEEGLLDTGEYVVIGLEKEESFDASKKHQFIRREFEASMMEADPLPFRNVLLVCPGSPKKPDYLLFQDRVLNYSYSPPFNIPRHPDIRVEVPIYAGLAYDAVMIYASALTQALANNGSEYDGTTIFQYIKSRPYESILGFSVMMDEQGDAEGNYTVMALVEDFEGPPRMRPVAGFTYQGLDDLPLFRLDRPINWIAGTPPKSEPECGFTGQKCNTVTEWKTISIYTACCLVSAIAGLFVFRHYRYEQKLACLLWKVDPKELVILRSDHDRAFQKFRSNLYEIENSKLESDILGDTTTPGGRSQSLVGFYKGNAVYIYHVYKKSIDLTRSLRKEMIQIREMRHENINPFIGACVDPPTICVLSLFSARGSLQDVLKNSDLHLDMMFIASLVADLVKGMIYLHESEILSHGNLKSSNCIVDNRWMLKITDFGLHEFRAGQDLPPEVQDVRARSLLWRAPELIRTLNLHPRGTQKGDVYSFGIILFEILGRQGPWGTPEPSLKYIEDRVSNPGHYGDELFRPPSHLLDCPDYLQQCMEDCWQEDPDDRPDFKFIKVKLRPLHSGLNANIFDNMISIMEKYACNLESVVKDRTYQLLEEKKKTENLLLRMLPKPVAEQLLRGEKVEAESFDCVTIYFSDIVGFTSLSAISTPLQVVDLLNDLYTVFDSIIGHYDVYKVETIGDAYMVVSGLPIRNGDAHAAQVASLALRLRAAIETFEIRHRPADRLSLRIGINSGPCVAGVVGLKMPRYCLFGDTVNTASRMESTGEAMKIHVSEACKNILDKLGGYVLKERGMVHIKGKGEMRTFWLMGRTGGEPDSSQDFRTNTTFSSSERSVDLFSSSSCTNESCLSLFDECRKNAKNAVLRDNEYRSAPVVGFSKTRSSPGFII